MRPRSTTSALYPSPSSESKMSFADAASIASEIEVALMFYFKERIDGAREDGGFLFLGIDIAT